MKNLTTPYTRMYALVLLVTCAAFGAGRLPVKGAGNPKIFYNQVGYVNHAPKMLLVSEDVDRVAFVDADGKEVLSVKSAPAQFWEASGNRVRKVDFSALTIPGRYTVVLPGAPENPVITINSKPYHKLARSVMKAFYLWRSGMPILERYAGQWARQEGHPDTVVYVHASAAGVDRPAGTVISSPKGWYDAGDYNKYIVNSAISTYTLFRALEDFPGFYTTLNLNIPESGNGGPDILDEAMYNFEWMLSMQDPEDGGVYHKLTNKLFDPVIMPEKATSDRFVAMKTTAATLDFAAVAAHASVLLKAYGKAYPGIAERSLAQARKAWNWAKQHPGVIYKQPDDIKTGAYGDKTLKDEWFWAAAELYLATGEQEFAEALMTNYQRPVTPEWAIVHGLGFMSLLTRYESLPDAVKKTGLKKDFFQLADSLVNLSASSPYGVSIRSFRWGSNAQVSNEGMLKLFAYQQTSERKYYGSALSDLDYLLGRNATGFCFVTGYGDKRVMHIHHRLSQADGIPEPLPGYLAGGPNLDTFADCPPGTPRSKRPATSYVDMDCSYSTNEVAINWNAPLVYLSGGMDAL
jgi:endoglucanase